MVAPPAEIRSPGTTPRGAGRAPPSAPDPRGTSDHIYDITIGPRACVCELHFTVHEHGSSPIENVFPGRGSC